jgi:CTP-dependent riboflavin kinase
MAVRITGTVIRGEGNAERNHSVLIPLLARHLPEIANSSQFGTINVQLDQALDKSRADIWTRRIIWEPIQWAQRRVEIFGFIRIKLEYPVNGPIYDCWIILPEGSRLTYSADKAEIIADVFIQGVAYGAGCVINIDHTPSIPAPQSFGVIHGMSFRQ